MAAAPRWLAWLLLATGAATLLGLAGLPTVSWWWLGLAVLLVLTPPGRMLLAAGGGPPAPARRRAGQLPAWGQGAPPAVGRGTAGRPAGRANLVGGAVHHLVRAAARRARSARMSTCTPSPRSPGCSDSATAAPSSPRWTSPATGSTATCCGWARSASAAVRASAPAACCAPAPVGDDAEVAAGSAVFGNVPDGRVLVRRAGATGQRRGPRPLVGAAELVTRMDGGVRRHGHAGLGLLPAVAVAVVAWLVLPSLILPPKRRLGRCGIELIPGSCQERSSRCSCSPRWCSVSSGCARSGWSRASTGSGAGSPSRCGPPCGCSTRRAPGSSRCTPPC